MIASAVAAVRTPSTLEPVGRIDRPWRQDEPLFLDDERSGPEAGFTSLDDAIAGASYMSQTGDVHGTDWNSRRAQGAAFLVRREGDVYRATALAAPVWERSWGVEKIAGYSYFKPQSLHATPAGELQVGFSIVKREADDVDATGVLRIDSATGGVAIVGEGWSFANGRLDRVESRDPFERPQRPEPKPQPQPEPSKLPPLAQDVQDAVALINQSIAKIETVPVTDTGDASTKAARIGAFELNKQAQAVLERQFLREGQAPAAVSVLRTADARLEDAAWQLAKKPSPDGRFNGVDIPGALRDSHAAVEELAKLAG